MRQSALAGELQLFQRVPVMMRDLPPPENYYRLWSHRTRQWEDVWASELTPERAADFMPQDAAVLASFYAQVDGGLTIFQAMINVLKLVVEGPKGGAA